MYVKKYKNVTRCHHFICALLLYSCSLHLLITLVVDKYFYEYQFYACCCTFFWLVGTVPRLNPSTPFRNPIGALGLYYITKSDSAYTFNRKDHALKIFISPYTMVATYNNTVTNVTKLIRRKKYIYKVSRCER